MTRAFAIVLLTQATFGFAWSIYLLVPKFMAESLSMRADDIGLYTSVSGFAAMAAVPLAGRWIDTYGRRRWITMGSTLLFLAALAFLQVEAMGPMLILGQVLQGVAFVFVFNAGGALVADIVPPERLAQAIGIFGASNLSMNAIAPATGEWLADTFGWSAVFTVSAAASLLAVVWSRFVLESPLKRRSASVPEGSSLSRDLVMVYMVGAAMAVSFATLLILHQPYALERGVTELKSFFIGFTVTALTVRIGMGSFTDRVGSLKVSIVSMSLYALVPPMLGFLGPEHLLIVGGLLGFSHGALYPALTALALERCAPGSRGMVLSLLNGAFNGGMAISGIVFGWVAAESGYAVAFGSSAVVTALGVALLVSLKRLSPGSLPRVRQ